LAGKKTKFFCGGGAAGTPVFIPAGVTADTVFHHIQALANGIAFRAKVSEPCYSTAIEMLCSTALRPCLQLSINGKNKLQNIL